MYINPIRLTNNYNTNTYKYTSFKGDSAQAESLTTESTPTVDTTQFKSSVKSKDKGTGRNQSFVHKLYKTLTTSISGASDPYFPVSSSSRPFLYQVGARLTVNKQNIRIEISNTLKLKV